MLPWIHISYFGRKLLLTVGVSYILLYILENIFSQSHYFSKCTWILFLNTRFRISVLILFPEDDIKKASLIQPGRKESGFKVFKKKEMKILLKLPPPLLTSANNASLKRCISSKLPIEKFISTFKKIID